MTTLIEGRHVQRKGTFWFGSTRYEKRYILVSKHEVQRKVQLGFEARRTGNRFILVWNRGTGER